MCLILVAWQCHPRYALVVAANRDEFYARPTVPAAFWAESPNLLAGKDLQAGGSWLGITRQGRFAALTNYRDPASHKDDAPSRGRFVADFLLGRDSLPDYLDGLAAKSSRDNGFNLLIGDSEKLAWYSNAGGAPRLLPPGIYGVSNHLLDTPWPKVEAAKSALAQALAALPDDTDLLRLLHDETRYPDDMLPRTGISLEWERLLSAAFIQSPAYGTRCSTVLLKERNGWTTFDEQTWSQSGSGSRVRYRFKSEDTTS
jgi:uncharacterized protein with NRDE domain